MEAWVEHFGVRKKLLSVRYIKPSEISRDLPRDYDTWTDWCSLSSRYDSLKADGVRMVYPGTDDEPNLLSNALEPEYIEYNKDQTKAYVTLQVWSLTISNLHQNGRNIIILVTYYEIYRVHT